MVGPTLITGGRGLVGTWVRHWWQPSDGELVVVDHGEVDLLEPGAAADVVRRTEPSRVVHLAWSASGTTGYRHSDLNRRWLQASLELVGAARAASAAVWVTGTALDDRSGAPDAYTDAKHELRTQLADDIAAGALGWLRPFYVFDQAQGRPEVVASAVAARAEGRPVTLRSPDARHDFVHASDVGAGIVAAVRAGLRGLVEIGSGTARSVAELVTALGIAWEPDTVPQPGPEGTDAVADADALRGAGWVPRLTDELFGAETVPRERR